MRLLSNGYSKLLWPTFRTRYFVTLRFFRRANFLTTEGPIATGLQIARMAEDTGAPTSSSAKHHCDEDTAQGSPKRVRVDTQPPVNVALNPGSDVLQSNKKPPKRRDAAGYPKSRHGKEKDNKNVGRRRGNRSEVNETHTSTSEPVPQDLSEKSPRLPKRQSAILLGFCGTGCAGMQMLVLRSTVSVHPILTNASVASQMSVRSKECYSTRSCKSARCPQIMRTIPRKLTSDVRLVRTRVCTPQETSYP
jgi:hypothetical protein